ncbi:hypothetical protein [Ekhidna sp.]|uniref:hypothetical protein n=1 Tax=Ekhidna sp. TaxID=2608089 RepID=UPI003B504ACB
MKRPNQHLFPFLFVPFYFRLLASGMNFINLNDEGKVSAALGIGTFTIPIIVSLFLFVLVYNATRKLYFKQSFIAWTTLITMLFSSILILSDQAYNFRIL